MKELFHFNYAIRELELEGNLANYEGVAKIADALTYTTALSALNLNHVDVGEKGAIAFADYFGDKRNTILTSLTLIGANINDMGAHWCLKLKLKFSHLHGCSVAIVCCPYASNALTI